MTAMGVEAGLFHYLVLAAVLLALGIYAVLTRRNAVMMLIGVELILNAANINFVAFSRYGGVNLGGQVTALLVTVLAAAELAVALAIVLNLYRVFATTDVQTIDRLRD